MQLFYLLFWLTMQKGEAHKKAIYGREIIPRLHSLVKSFCRDFLKNFFYTQCPQSQNCAYFCIALREIKSRAILNCRLFAFSLKMILNLILKLNLKMNSNSKLVFNLILNLILNLKMFYVSRET